ncbi:hypothetical protein LDENG_00256110 [Lucifuga dentata]|nr:hypothetical protein LDENG_00256110 [Lucifuga dentata]
MLWEMIVSIVAFFFFFFFFFHICSSLRQLLLIRLPAFNGPYHYFACLSLIYSIFISNITDNHFPNHTTGMVN